MKTSQLIISAKMSTNLSTNSTILNFTVTLAQSCGFTHQRKHSQDKNTWKYLSHGNTSNTYYIYSSGTVVQLRSTFRACEQSTGNFAECSHKVTWVLIQQNSHLTFTQFYTSKAGSCPGSTCWRQRESILRVCFSRQHFPSQSGVSWITDLLVTRLPL